MWEPSPCGIFYTPSWDNSLALRSPHPPPIWHSFSLRNVSSVSWGGEEEGGGRPLVPLLLPKISLVKFSLSQRQGCSGSGVCREKEGERGRMRKTERRRKEEGVLRRKHWERASEQIAQAKLAQWAQYVLERFANRSLFFIAKMKAAWAGRECQTHLLVCTVDYALSMCAYVQGWRC